MKTIPLTRGKHALVDDADYAYLSQFRWHAHRCDKRFYAMRCEPRKDGGKHVCMHRVIMDAKRGQQLDHRNGNGLDNQRHNLRWANDSQNQFNRGPHPQNQHGFRGVSVDFGKYWKAKIKVMGKNHYLGCFATPQEAARAYDAAAIQFAGEFAWTNAAHGLI